MVKKRNASKLALHSETIRQLNDQQLLGVQGAGSRYTATSCSSQTNEYTCCVTEPPTIYCGNSQDECPSFLC